MTHNSAFFLTRSQFQPDEAQTVQIFLKNVTFYGTIFQIQFLRPNISISTWTANWWSFLSAGTQQNLSWELSPVFTNLGLHLPSPDTFSQIGEMVKPEMGKTGKEQNTRRCGVLGKEWMVTVWREKGAEMRWIIGGTPACLHAHTITTQTHNHRTYTNTNTKKQRQTRPHKYYSIKSLFRSKKIIGTNFATNNQKQSLPFL